MPEILFTQCPAFNSMNRQVNVSFIFKGTYYTQIHSIAVHDLSHIIYCWTNPLENPCSLFHFLLNLLNSLTSFSFFSTRFYSSSFSHSFSFRLFLRFPFCSPLFGSTEQIFSAKIPFISHTFCLLSQSQILFACVFVCPTKILHNGLN